MRQRLAFASPGCVVQIRRHKHPWTGQQVLRGSSSNSGRWCFYLRDPYDISDRTAGHLFRLARCKNLLEGNEEKGLNDSDLKVLYYCGKDAQTLRQLRGIVDEMIG